MVTTRQNTYTSSNDEYINNGGNEAETNVDAEMKINYSKPKEVAKELYDRYKNSFAYFDISPFKDECRYSGRNWFIFKNHKWNQDINSLQIQIGIRDGTFKLDMTDDEWQTFKTNIMSDSFKKRVFLTLYRLFHKYNGETQDSFDKNPFILCCNNGVVDLTTGELRDGRPEDMCSMSTGLDYKPYTFSNEYMPQINNFIHEIVAKDSYLNVIDFLTEILYPYKHSDYKELHWIFGNGSNGKTSMLNLIKNSLGDYCTITFDLFTKNQNHNYLVSSPQWLHSARNARALIQNDTEIIQDVQQLNIIKLILSEDSFSTKGKGMFPSRIPEWVAPFTTCFSSNVDVFCKISSEYKIADSFMNKIVFDKTFKGAYSIEINDMIKNAGSDFLSYLVYLSVTRCKRGPWC